MDALMTILYLIIGIIISFYFHKSYIIGKDLSKVEESSLMIGMAAITICWPIYLIYKVSKMYYEKRNP